MNDMKIGFVVVFQSWKWDGEHVKRRLGGEKLFFQTLCAVGDNNALSVERNHNSKLPSRKAIDEIFQLNRNVIIIFCVTRSLSISNFDFS